MVAVESIEVVSGPLTNLRPLRRWFPTPSGFRAGDLLTADASISVVLDDFAFVLYIGGIGGEVSGTHEGAEFAAAARDGTVDVYITEQIDVRRSKPSDLDAAAARRQLVGASVAAYVVQNL